MDIYIANHAVRRYAERVLRCTTRGPFTSAMAKVEAQTGLSVEDIRAAIIADIEPYLPEKVMRRGFRKVVRGIRARYVVEKGAIHTCYRGDEFEEDEDD